MIPADFKESNLTLQKPDGMTDEECGPLPVYTDGDFCLSSWQASWKERLSVLLFGKVWIWVYGGQTQPPIALEGIRTPFRKVAVDDD